MNYSQKNQNHKKFNKKLVSKTLQILLLVLAIGISQTAQAQSKEKTKEKDSTKAKNEVQADNFMDLFASTLGQTFGENLDGKSTGKKLSYIELLEKAEIPAAQKAEYKNWYYLHLKKDLTQKQKDSLGKALEKKINETKKEQH